MSPEDVVRQPLAVRSRSRRSIEQRLFVRFPRLVRSFAPVAWRVWRSLPPRSRLRRAFAHHYVRAGLEAYNRGDLAVAFLVHDPHCESAFAPEVVALGFEPFYREPEARLRAHRRWISEWGGFRFVPEELLDLVDGRLLILGRIQGTGLSSRITIDNDWAYFIAISGGQVVQERFFLDRSEALKALGMPER